MEAARVDLFGREVVRIAGGRVEDAAVVETRLHQSHEFLVVEIAIPDALELIEQPVGNDGILRAQAAAHRQGYRVGSRLMQLAGIAAFLRVAGTQASNQASQLRLDGIAHVSSFVWLVIEALKALVRGRFEPTRYHWQ